MTLKCDRRQHSVIGTLASAYVTFALRFETALKLLQHTAGCNSRTQTAASKCAADHFRSRRPFYRTTSHISMRGTSRALIVLLLVAYGQSAALQLVQVCL